ncbi:MAG TPA: XRE family transcriptional regulator [Pyrinomonadaceae bacterium]|jgi:Zn-dependent peptidase ImmA (M78 family)/DNA-binding XRE family transcriptional regulator
MKFNPSRLVLARKRRGLSKTALADAAQIGLRSIVYYESGEVEPSEEAVQSLAYVLQFPTPFFYAPDLEEIACDAASFRSLSTMTASQRDASLAAGTLAVALGKWIDEKFELPKPTVPSLRNFEPETAAQVLREEWRLGESPIKNVVHLLEMQGVRVFSLPIDSASVDAFSVWHHETPFIFLNPQKSGERGRMDAAHELGHLTLHGHGIPRSRQAELEADRFASAFLMPAKDVFANIPRGQMEVSTIHKLKKRWRVSAIALVHRLKALQIITEWQYRTFCIELSQAGFRSSEKDGIVRETSQVLAKVFNALREEGKSRHAIARDLMITSTELDSLLVGLFIASIANTQTEVNPSDQNQPTKGRADLKAV